MSEEETAQKETFEAGGLHVIIMAFYILYLVLNDLYGEKIRNSDQTMLKLRKQSGLSFD